MAHAATALAKLGQRGDNDACFRGAPVVRLRSRNAARALLEPDPGHAGEGTDIQPSGAIDTFAYSRSAFCDARQEA